MKQVFYTVAENEKLARDIYRMRLTGDTSALTASGQFVNLTIEGKFLRRPISVCDWDENGLTLIYKVVGAGTEIMSGMKAGTVIQEPSISQPSRAGKSAKLS